MSFGIGMPQNLFGMLRASAGGLGYGFGRFGGRANAARFRADHADRAAGVGPATKAAQAPTRSVTDLRAMSASRETSAELRVVTDEGDVVTIRGRSELEVTYAKLQHRERSEDGSVKLKAEMREIQLDEEFSVSVEGDLNEEELADIKSLMGRIGDSLGGLSPGMYGMQVESMDLGSLESFEFKLERSFTMTRLHVRQRTVAEPPEAIEPPESEDDDAEETPVADAPAVPRDTDAPLDPMRVLEAFLGRTSTNA